MPTTDPRITTYIAHAAPFAVPILTHLRTLIHTTCPTVEESLKWGMPHFSHHGVLCSMAAFKTHCAFGFWKGALIFPHDDAKAQRAMGQFGAIRSLKDLPADSTLTRYIQKAMALNESGIKRATPPKHKKPALRTPSDLAAALKLKKHARARAHWDAFPPGQRREYIEWITEAKRPETRASRLATTLEWLAEGKHRNWKYQKK